MRALVYHGPGALKVVLQGSGVTHAEPVEEAVLVAG
jgi:hypothetical protein